MKKVLTLGVLALFAGACVLTAFGAEEKWIHGQQKHDDKGKFDYFTIKGEDGKSAIWAGTVAGMNGVWVHAPEKVEGNHGIGLIADGGGTRLVFGTSKGKGAHHNRMGLGVGDNGKPYMWFVDADGKIRHIDLSKLPELK